MEQTVDGFCNGVVLKSIDVANVKNRNKER